MKHDRIPSETMALGALYVPRRTVQLGPHRVAQNNLITIIDWQPGVKRKWPYYDPNVSGWTHVRSYRFDLRVLIKAGDRIVGPLDVQWPVDKLDIDMWDECFEHVA